MRTPQKELILAAKNVIKRYPYDIEACLSERKDCDQCRSIVRLKKAVEEAENAL